MRGVKIKSGKKRNETSFINRHQQKCQIVKLAKACDVEMR